MNRRSFDAFALPGPEARELALAGYDEPRVRVRHVDASPEWIAGVADALRASRNTLVERPVTDVAAALGAVGARFLDEEDDLRAEALDLLPATSGLSPEMSAAVLDGMARDWTEHRLLGLLAAELGDAAVLDRPLAAGGSTPRPGTSPTTGAGTERSTGGTGAVTRSMAVGPALCVQIVAGSVPGVGVTALLRSLLVKGPTLLKPGRGDVALPVLFARALRAADEELAASLAVVYWPGGRPRLEAAALARADVVTAYGSDETVRELRGRAPVTARFVPYHHRVSVGIVGREALREGAVAEAAADVARAAAFFDQRGCVSPQIVYVEVDGDGEAPDFARWLASALGELEDRLPSGELDAEQASSLQQARGTVELMAAAGEVEVVHGGAAPWTVIVDSGSAPAPGGPGRTLRIRPVRDARDVPALLEPLSSHLQTVGVAGLGRRVEDIARALGRVGASRVVPFSSVAFPPPWWHHDGRGPLLDLVRWVDVEEG